MYVVVYYDVHNNVDLGYHGQPLFYQYLILLIHYTRTGRQKLALKTYSSL